MCAIFKNRVIEKDKLVYYIHSIDLNNNWISLMPLFDSNGIKVDLEYYKSKGSFINFKFSDLDKNFKFFSKQESEDQLKEHQESNKILKVLYKFESSKVIDLIVAYREKRIAIESVLPEYINSSDYNFDTSGDCLNSVKTKKDNIRVMFTAEEIKDEYESLPVSLKIYYSFFKTTVNIIHIHKCEAAENTHPDLDINEYELIHIGIGEDFIKYKNFKSGKRLKIIFQNYKLKRIYFLDINNQVIELKGQDYNYKLERIVKVEAKSECLFNNYFAKIKKIPLYKLAEYSQKSEIKFINLDAEILDSSNSYDRIAHCDLHSGYIDLEIIFDDAGNYIYPPHYVSLPICFLSFLPIDTEMEFERSIANEKKKRNSQEIQTLLNMKNEIQSNYIKYHESPESLYSLNKEEMQKIHANLNSFKLKLPEISLYLEQKELWAYFEDVSRIEEISNSIQNIINQKIND
jgi:hypothetical protein